MTMRKTSLVVTVIVTVIVGSLLAACSSSSKKSETKGKTQSTSTVAPTGTRPLVTVKKDAKLGQVLADSRGLTLYTLAADNKPVPCSGACEQVWPPLEAPAGAAAPSSSPSVKGLTAVAGPDGHQLVALDGFPLYRFAKDKDSGDAYGEGIQSFGGVWHAATPAGSQSAPKAAPTTAKSGY